jgi:hypothetical protein
MDHNKEQYREKIKSSIEKSEFIGSTTEPHLRTANLEQAGSEGTPFEDVFKWYSEPALPVGGSRTVCGLADDRAVTPESINNVTNSFERLCKNGRFGKRQRGETTGLITVLFAEKLDDSIRECVANFDWGDGPRLDVISPVYHFLYIIDCSAKAVFYEDMPHVRHRDSYKFQKKLAEDVFIPALNE